MVPATLDRWVWLLVYGGLITLALGLSLAKEEAALGVLLIYLRSRMKG